MAAQRYFPQAEADRIIWLNHYAAKLVKYGPLLGISPEEIASTLAASPRPGPRPPRRSCWARAARRWRTLPSRRWWRWCAG